MWRSPPSASYSRRVHHGPRANGAPRGCVGACAAVVVVVMSASRAQGVGSRRLLRTVRKGLVVCALLLCVLVLREEVFRGPEVYGQETHSLTQLLLSSTQQHLQEQLGQRKLFHVSTRDLYLPAYFNLVHPQSPSSQGDTGDTVSAIVPPPPSQADRDSATTTTSSSANCTLTRTRPAFHICVYPQQQDIFISAALTSQGVWEPQITKLFQQALRRFPQALVIDVGANIGYYSLLAAAMGHRVVAVEPSRSNVQRLVQGVRLNGLSQEVYVLQNALAKSHRNVSLSVNTNNQGGIKVLEDRGHGHQTTQTIVLNDLLHLLGHSHSHAQPAIIKIDIEGYECRGMATSAKLFRNVFVPYILMEWQQMYKYRHQMSAACSVDVMRQMTDYFVRLGYHAHEVRTGLALNPQRSTTAWQVGDVYWRHDSQPPLTS